MELLLIVLIVVNSFLINHNQKIINNNIIELAEELEKIEKEVKKK